jgi:hypothetical protein
MVVTVIPGKQLVRRNKGQLMNLKTLEKVQSVLSVGCLSIHGKSMKHGQMFW